ncbi:MAG: hypothetical protein PHY45_04320 [Rhodocyclaceae bacterium]|nr:hypothetical protein [Rhodocyclaceae bacterium]
MKIHQLPQGARFVYEGKEYVKTGPMFATSNGQQRLIPKYAVLEPLGEAESTREEAKPDFLARARVLRAFETFYAECKLRVPDHQQTALAAARGEFLKALD